MKRSHIVFFSLCLLFIFDFPSTFESEISDQLYCFKPADSSLETWLFAFSSTQETIQISKFVENAGLTETFTSVIEKNEKEEQFFTLLNHQKATHFKLVAWDEQRVLLQSCARSIENCFDNDDSSPEKIELTFTRCSADKLLVSAEDFESISEDVSRHDSNSSSPTTYSDPVNFGNQLGFAFVFIVLFIPPLVMLIVQTVRAVKFQKNRGTYAGFFWLHLKDRPDRFNLHNALKIGFILICSIRILHAVLFVISTLIGQSSINLDRVIRFWIDYVNFTLLFGLATGIVFYWVELGLASLRQIGKREIFSRRLTIFFVIVNLIFHIADFVLLPLLAREEGDPSSQLFRLLYNFIVAIPMLLIIIFVFLIILVKFGREVRATNEKSKIRKAYHRLEVFIVAILVACIIRILIGFVLAFGSYSTVVAALMIFIAASIPEMILSYTFIAFTWIRRRDVLDPDQKKELLDDDDTTIAPEVVKFEDDQKKVELEQQN